MPQNRLKIIKNSKTVREPNSGLNLIKTSKLDKKTYQKPFSSFLNTEKYLQEMPSPLKMHSTLKVWCEAVFNGWPLKEFRGYQKW